MKSAALVILERPGTLNQPGDFRSGMVSARLSCAVSPFAAQTAAPRLPLPSGMSCVATVLAFVRMMLERETTLAGSNEIHGLGPVPPPAPVTPPVDVTPPLPEMPALPVVPANPPEPPWPPADVAPPPPPLPVVPPRAVPPDPVDPLLPPVGVFPPLPPLPPMAPLPAVPAAPALPPPLPVTPPVAASPPVLFPARPPVPFPELPPPVHAARDRLTIAVSSTIPPRRLVRRLLLVLSIARAHLSRRRCFCQAILRATPASGTSPKRCRRLRETCNCRSESRPAGHTS